MIGLLKQVKPYPEITVPREMNPIIQDETADPGAEEEMLETQEFHVEMPTPVKEVPEPKRKKQAKTKINLKELATGKTKPPRSKKTKEVVDTTKCLYHPDTDVVDTQRQLCSSCKWKLKYNGLTEHDKDPEVISFLKGETKIVPFKGQQMCPIHPNMASYNKKTGLCQRCQSKARSTGIKDRPLTEEELEQVRNPVV